MVFLWHMIMSRAVAQDPMFSTKCNESPKVIKVRNSLQAP